MPSAGFFKWKGYDWKPNPGWNLNLICLLVTYLPAWKMLFCRCLLLTHFSCFRALDLGFRTVQEKFVKLNQELSRLQGAYRDAQEGELSSYYGSWTRSWVGNREPTEMPKKVSWVGYREPTETHKKVSWVASSWTSSWVGYREPTETQKKVSLVATSWTRSWVGYREPIEMLKKMSRVTTSWTRIWVGYREPTEMHKKVSRETTS